MAASKNTIKNWFLTGLFPTQEQFAQWIDAYWHKDEKISQESVDNLITDLDNKVEQQTFDSHLNDPDAHANLQTAFHHTTFRPPSDNYEIVLPELIDAELDCVMFSGLVDMETIQLDPATGTLYNWEFTAGIKYIIFYTKI